ncbi:uncharacterized protein LOC110040520 [Orbicella faveolata]|uniref:uncharacterized protein LOC110040520 n=1 Tax=Orbicella faveolata TaxID=48498 RepID=UPI0009E6212D|nr:uncharacterized protein LOC110040520 [Orbicella faveolata]
MRRPTRWGFLKKFSHVRSNLCETMAENAEREPDLVAVFDDSGDEGSFDGFEGRRRDHDSDSAVDLVGLEDDDGGPAPGGTNDEEEEARWTDYLSDFPILDFTAASGLNFNLPDIPNPFDYFLEFVGDDLWNFIVVKTNRYVHQKLSNSPERFANFIPVTCAEIKAFIGINIIMGISRLPQLSLHWSSDDYFGKQGIKKVMTKNRFEEITYLHFNDSSVEPAWGTPGFDHLYKIRPIFNYFR